MFEAFAFLCNTTHNCALGVSPYRHNKTNLERTLQETALRFAWDLKKYGDYANRDDIVNDGLETNIGVADAAIRSDVFWASLQVLGYLATFLLD